MLSEFLRGHNCTCFKVFDRLHLDGANLQMQTHFVPKIIHPNIAIILWQLCCSKISLLVLIPSTKLLHANIIKLFLP